MIDTLVDIYDSWSKGGRAKDLKQLASEYNFRYERRVDFGRQPSDIKSFKVFSKKGIKRFMGVMETDLENVKGTVRFYDYIRTRDLETSTQSVVEVYCQDVSTDYFMIEPKSFVNRAKYLLKFSSKIHSELKPFHKAYFIHTESTNVQYVLNKKAMSLILAYPNLKVEARGHCFVFYMQKDELPIGQIMPLIDFAEDFVSLLATGEDDGYV